MPEHMLEGQGAGLEREGIQDVIQKTGPCSRAGGEVEATEATGRLAGAVNEPNGPHRPRAPGPFSSQVAETHSLPTPPAPPSVYALIGICADNTFV